MGINIGYEAKNVGDYTEITSTIIKTPGLAAKPGYQNLYVGKSEDGFVDVGFMTIIRSGDTKPSPVVLEQIPLDKIGKKGIKITGSVTLGNINFNQFETVKDETTGESTIITKKDDKGEALFDTNKSVEIVGTDGADHVVFDGDLGKTKVTAKLDKGNDTLIVEQNAIGAVNVDFGDDIDLLWNARFNNGDSIFEVNELDGAMKPGPEKNTSGEFKYIK